MKVIKTVSSILVASLLSIEVFASEKDPVKLHREMKRYGFYTGLISDPGGAFSLSAAAYISRYARLNIGVGAMGDINNFNSDTPVLFYGGGANFFLLPYNLTPVLGLQLAYAHQDRDKGQDDLFGKRSPHPSRNSFTSYFNVGGEWQAHCGCNVGLGMHVYSIRWKEGPGPKSYPSKFVTGYLQWGWFF